MDEKRAFIVVPASASSGTALRELLDEIEGNLKDSVVVRRIVGGSQAPQRILIDATDEAIGQIQQQFAQRLLVEPDLPLQMS